MLVLVLVVGGGFGGDGDRRFGGGIGGDRGFRVGVGDDCHDFIVFPGVVGGLFPCFHFVVRGGGH